MKVSEILKKNEVTISCEIFPPKQGAQLQNYKAIAAEIAKLKPAYISCTYEEYCSKHLPKHPSSYRPHP